MIHQRAMQLAQMGFHVFPLKANSKLPAWKGFTEKATCDPKKVEGIWFNEMLELHRNYNIGIATSYYEGGALLVVDVDNKKGKNGSQSVKDLAKAGFKLPKTLQQKTPTGGFHLIYKVKEGVPNSVEKIAPGIDIRSKGGFIVGAGSMIDGKTYLINSNEIATAPQWLEDKCNASKVDARKTKKAAKKIDQRGAKVRGKEYLLNSAPVAIEGDGGDQTTFRVASRLKDIGLTEANALKSMLDNWNDNCQPPWDVEELTAKVKNAYIYGQNAVGADSPENDFEPVPMDKEAEKKTADDKLGPIEELNKEFSFVVLGGKSAILRQVGKGPVDYMVPGAFHDLLAARTIQTGSGKRRRLSELWFESPLRNTYHSIELIPGKKAPPGVYNLWRGFACEPLGPDEKPTEDMIKGVAMFQEHALKNICQNNEELYQWLMGYFAHLIQRPWEKPLTALVFKGKKGVGKNALIDRVGNLFNGHVKTTSNKRYLVSNFNKHLSNLIMFVLDEAFWSGDKQAEAILKDLITGKEHLIEHKGREMFSAPNVLRVIVLGNENWVVPASEDERRFAIFNVGDGRRKDKPFFRTMRKLIDNKGGNRLLMTELLKFDLGSVDVDEAPVTEGLLDQKIESLNTLHGWWHASLKDGAILNLDFNEDWPKNVGRQQLRAAYSQYARELGVRSWLPNAAAFGRDLTKCCPGLGNKRLRDEAGRRWAYTIPNLKTARAEFDAFIEHGIDWEPEEEENNVIDLFS